jgi:hypothetical protein
VPGSGKSTIWKALKEKLGSMDETEWTYDSVSSDTIRASLMKEFQDKGQTKKQAFDATGRSGPKAYGDAFARLCSEAHTSVKGKNHVIFLDKNHPVNGIPRVLDDIRKNLRGNIIVKKLYLVPDVSAGKPTRLAEYPFSENFLCQMFSWG